MNLTIPIWFRPVAILTAVIAYLLFAAAVIVAQTSTGQTDKQDTSTPPATILISGKVVEQSPPAQQQEMQSTARIIIQQPERPKTKMIPATNRQQHSAHQNRQQHSAHFGREQQQLARPIRPTAIPTTNSSTQRQSSQPNMMAAENSTTVKLPDVSHQFDAKLNVPGSVNNPGSGFRISDLPSIDPAQNQFSARQDQANQAVYYPNTRDRFQVTPVNLTYDPVRQEPTNNAQFADRENFNMLSPLMPGKVQVPGEQKSQDKRRVDPRVQKFLSSGEFLHDGGDRKLQVVVGNDWSVQGLDPQDTVGHFDTLDGERVVVPSNRVSIYAPRFAAVQKIVGLNTADSIDHLAKVDDKTPTFQSGTFDVAASSKQHTATVRNIGRKSATALQDRTRGLTIDNTTHSAMASNVIKAQQFQRFLQTGYLDNSEKAFLATAMQAAITWSADLEVKILIKELQPILVHEVKAAQETITIDPKGKNAKLRVVKMADKRAAQPGEEVEFMIRFDNIGQDLIGNVTVIDNLTTRLEYIEGSASCSVKADLITSQNDAHSTQLRWEIVDPLKIGEGGVIRFKCRVR